MELITYSEFGNMDGWPGNSVDWKEWYVEKYRGVNDRPKGQEWRDDHGNGADRYTSSRNTDYKEICEEMNLTPNQYWTLLREALDAFAQAFEREYGINLKAKPEYVLQYLSEIERRNLMHRGQLSCRIQYSLGK